VEQARAAIARKAYDEADTLLNEAQREADAAGTKVDEIEKARNELKSARDSDIAGLRAAKARAIGEARVTIAEARVAVRARRLDEAERKLREARAKLDEATKMPGGTVPALADAEREYADVLKELNEARSRPPDIEIKQPDVKLGGGRGMPQGAWPRETTFRNYVEQSLRKLFPD
jgi:DNA repair exonuclease SbcCD ATPase subunit